MNAKEQQEDYSCPLCQTKKFSHRKGMIEHLQVLHYRRQRHVERLGQLAHRRRAAAEPLDDYPSPWVGQGLEHPVQRRRRAGCLGRRAHAGSMWK